MFVNFSNHPSEKWEEKQINKALEFGKITDIPFPDVSPEMSEDEIDDIAKDIVEKIVSLNPKAVMCQGEYTLSFNVSLRLLKKGINVVCACSERCTIETQSGKNNMRNSLFSFVKFRKLEL
ncbi:MAG: hypothetical protein E7404_05520 [Ruminococcaceae bacterium]|nr:hypothetical protein [Oscillospiraceae bacterium]